MSEATTINHHGCIITYDPSIIAASIILAVHIYIAAVLLVLTTV